MIDFRNRWVAVAVAATIAGAAGYVLFFRHRLKQVADTATKEPLLRGLPALPNRLR